MTDQHIRSKSLYISRKKILWTTLIVIALVCLVQALLFGRSLYGVSQYNKLSQANSDVVNLQAVAIKSASSAGMQSALTDLSQNLQTPQGAMCYQNDTFFFVDAQQFQTNNVKCITYANTVKQAKEAADQLVAMGAYTSSLNVALAPVAEAGASGTDPKVAIDAYAKSANRVAKLQPPQIWKFQHEQLVSLLKTASTDASAIAETQKIQSVDGFAEKSAAMQKSVAALNAIGTTLHKSLTEKSVELQSTLATLSQK